ncbi:MAG TPA: amino acid ABC transporter substrate-binding protein, partial [Quisquiliibacterium sp.]|nr:amino acid ABC transporter substrate-binding protein [Quisquiliibacterium sp.]
MRFLLVTALWLGLGFAFGLPGPADAAPAQGARDRLERIRAAGELRVCIWPDYYGITFRNP